MGNGVTGDNFKLKPESIKKYKKLFTMSYVRRLYELYELCKANKYFFMERLKHFFFVSKKFGIFLLLYKDRKTKL